jgi:2-dehydropantoate 2-reductase
MKILVVGAGATGGYFGARLAQAGRDVTFLVRPGRATAIRDRGLRLVGQGADEVLEPNLITAAELAGLAGLAGQQADRAAYDLVLLTVKATTLEAALDDLAPAVGPNTAIMPFLNGMSHLPILTERFGPAAITGGVVRVATMLNPEGDIVRLAPPADLTIGELDGQPSKRLAEFSAVLDVEGYKFTASETILADMWLKWVFVGSIGAFTSLAGGTIGEAVAVPGGAALAEAVVAEYAAVAAASGYPIQPAQLAELTGVITRPGLNIASSLYRDMSAGYPTEVEHVIADLAVRSRALGLGAPMVELATLRLRVHQNRVSGD